MRLRGMGESLAALLYPEDVVCFACNYPARADAYGLCSACAADICTPGDLPASEGISGYAAGLVYDETVRGAIHRFKFADARYIARHLVRFMQLPLEWKVDGVVPVPLHKARLSERGYNQSALLAQLIAKREGLPLEEQLLSRVRATQPQSRLNKLERAENVRSAFQAAPAAMGRTLLVIDDVRTTGNTLSACAHALIAVGAKRVYAMSACVALYGDVDA